MAIEVTCPSCGKTLNAKDSAVGKQANCPDCGSMISIPEPVYDAVEETPATGQFESGGEPQPPTDDRERSPCSMCGKMIISGVAKCRFCGEYLDSTVRGLWRQGNLLVMEKEATLPNRCVKSNAPASRGLTRKLTWHHPAIYLVVLINIIVYAIVAMIVQKRATIVVGLSDEWFARRRRAITIGWTALVLSGLLGCGGFMAAAINQEDGLAAIAAVVTVVLGLSGIIYGMVGSRIVTPKRMTDTHIWLKGVHPEYLAELPEWDGPSR